MARGPRRPMAEAPAGRRGRSLGEEGSAARARRSPMTDRATERRGAVWDRSLAVDESLVESWPEDRLPRRSEEPAGPAWLPDSTWFPPSQRPLAHARSRLPPARN